MNRSEETRIFCRMALEAGAVSQEEIDSAFAEADLQESLHITLLRMGVLDREKCDLLKRRVRDILSDRRRKAAKRFGKLVIDRGLASQEQVDECLAVQTAEWVRGTHRSIEGILVERGILTVFQVRHLLENIERVIMVCTVCQKRFKVLLDHAEKAECTGCSAPLRPVREGEKEDPEKDEKMEQLISEKTLIGKDFGGVRVETLIGRGAMGAVYKGRHMGLDRFVALKVLPMSDQDRGLVRILLHEARSTAKLEHPNIVQVHDVGYEHGCFFIVMQLLDGESLMERLQEVPVMEPAEAVRVVSEVARGLEVAHEAGIVHRDIKPANIMVTKTGDVRIADFGLAQDAGDPFRDPAGTVVGTPYYMPPEQWKGKKVDARGDLYSLGVVFFELLTGKRPFDGKDVRDVMGYHVSKAAPIPHKENPDVPEMLSAIVRKLLLKAPENRYPSARALLNDLKRFGKGETVGAMKEFGKKIKCGFCETINMLSSGKCSVCKEPLNPPNMKLKFARRKDEFKCPSCTGFITKGDRECRRCGQLFCFNCRVRAVKIGDYCRRCHERLLQ